MAASIDLGIFTVLRRQNAKWVGRSASFWMTSGYAYHLANKSEASVLKKAKACRS